MPRSLAVTDAWTTSLPFAFAGEARLRQARDLQHPAALVRREDAARPGIGKASRQSFGRRGSGAAAVRQRCGSRGSGAAVAAAVRQSR
ncbi:MAG TPA: hypothetical protein VGP26_08470 [Actinophytocola sp.]|nr:hypothetical protein [Actinophytocola sp.]